MPACVAAIDLDQALFAGRGQRLHVAVEHRLERLLGLPVGVLRRQRLDAVEDEGELEVHRLLDPQRAVVVERGDALVRRHEVRPALRRDARDEIDDRRSWPRRRSRTAAGRPGRARNCARSNSVSAGSTASVESRTRRLTAASKRQIGSHLALLQTKTWSSGMADVNWRAPATGRPPRDVSAVSRSGSCEFLSCCQDLVEVVARRVLHRRELLVGFKLLQPQQLADRQDVPVVEVRRARGARAHRPGPSGSSDRRRPCTRTDRA